MPTETNFVPENINCRNWIEIEPLINELLDRNLGSAAELENWLLEWSDLQAYVGETRARLHVDSTCHTDDEDVQKKYEDFQQFVMPHVKKASAAIDRKYYECEWRKELDADRYGVFDQAVATDIEIYRDENVELETEIAALQQEHGKVTGQQTVEFDGGTKTLPAMAKYQEDPERSVREGAWRAVTERLHQDKDALRTIFDKMYGIRQQIAKNAGFDNYRDYMFRKMHRFDYDVETCTRFHDAVAEHVVPLYRALGKERAEVLGVDNYRSWDTTVDVKNRAPLDPFDTNIERMVEGGQKIFDAMNPELGTMYGSLCDGTSLDLDTRVGKRPGGYQTTFTVARRPFIFMNAAGLGRDFRTLLHEAGHAFHSMLGGNDPLMAYRHAPIEFCEVASMSMELTAIPYLGQVYGSEEEVQRAVRVQLEGIVRLLCWIAQIDAFQHWLYTHDGHSAEERKNAWLGLDDRFGPGVDWSGGLEQYREESWQRQLHLYHYPFYYIEYGIAQLGALQIWLNYRADENAAIAQYKSALALGGSKPLPELFATAGAEFDFGSATISRLMTEIQSELATLPA